MRALPRVLAQGYHRELWQVFLAGDLPDACCGECAVGNTADCDVNPLKRPFTRGEIALKLLQEGLTP
jgi:hypothetical protein